VVAGIFAVLVVGACSHAPAEKSATPNGGQGRLSGGVLAPDQTGRAPAAAPPGQSVGAGAAGGAPGAAGEASLRLPLVGGVYQIRTAQLTVAVKGAQNVAARANAAETIAVAAGGEVDSDDRTSGPHATAALQLRVPPHALETTLTKLSRLGAEKTRQSSATDVKQKVADVRSRVASAQQSIDRLRTLFHRATKVSDIIALESELSSREADLESLEAQDRALARETSLATINLSLVTATRHHVPPVKHENRGGFLGGLQRGWDGFTAAAAWVAGAVGILLPFLVLLLVVALAARLVWPRLQHRQASPSE
jgi:hypothetical protein